MTGSTETQVGATDTPTPRPVFEDPQEASRKCNKWVETGLTKNAAIQFLLKHLGDLGCNPPEGFISCTQCPQPAAGGFGIIEEITLNKKSLPSSSINHPNGSSSSLCTSQEVANILSREQNGSSTLQIKPEIYLCQQYLQNEIMAHKTIVHELIHAIDLCRSKMDPLHNCIHMACTEIRAENLSGECSFFKELPRMKSFRGHGAECVKRRAILSVRANPNCSARAEDYVNAAMDRCFRDNYPFDRHPNQK